MEKFLNSLAPKDSPKQDTDAVTKRSRPKDVKATDGKLKGGVSKPKGFGGRASYFEYRGRKQKEQAPAAQTHVFKDCIVYFTGCASHSQLELTRLVWENGGTVLGHWARKSVTHVVSDRLSAGKMEKEIRSIGKSNAWRGAVVKPQWILSSVAHGEKQPTYEYLVIKPPCQNIMSLTKQSFAKPATKEHR